MIFAIVFVLFVLGVFAFIFGAAIYRAKSQRKLYDAADKFLKS